MCLCIFNDSVNIRNETELQHNNKLHISSIIDFDFWAISCRIYRCIDLSLSPYTFTFLMSQYYDVKNPSDSQVCSVMER